MKTLLLFKKYGMQYLGVCMLVLLQYPFPMSAQDGQNDAGFNSADHVSAQGANGTIKVSAVQSDNKIIVAGNFSAYNGTSLNGFARLKMDGKLDKSFHTGTGTDGGINAIAIQSNDRILIAGSFTHYNGNIANKIARLRSGGNIDNSFNAGDGANDSISQLILQPNGKILAAGPFTYYNGDTVRGLVRLNKNGTVDETFKASITDSIYKVRQIALLPDGKILVAGNDYSAHFMSGYSVIRLYADGSRDYSFNRYLRFTGDLTPGVNSIKIEEDGNILLSVTIYDGGSSIPYHGFLARLDSIGNEIQLQGLFWINSVQLQTDGKIIVAGFDNADWYVYQKKVVRLNPDLSIDSSFLFRDKKIFTDKDDAVIETTVFQLDGKIVIGGDFYEVSGLISNNIARLNPDGSFDHTFNQHTGFNGTVLASAVYNNRKLIIGGDFSRYNYQFRSNIVRLKENGDIDPTFDVGTGTNGNVNTIAIQSNGKIVIGGKFTLYNGNACSNVVRLNADGSFDENFDSVSTDGEVRKINIDKDGRILIAGDFSNVNGTPKPTIARIKTNGELDNTFHPTIEPYVRGYDFKISSRGKIYLAIINEDGLFSFGTDIYCLNKNGSRDLTFQIPTEKFFRINTLAFNNDNKLIAGGSGFYSNSLGKNSGFIVQFNADGSIDSTFDYKNSKNRLNGNVRTIHVLENDKIIIGGEFTANEFSAAHHIALLNKDGDFDDSFEQFAGNSIYTTSAVRNEKLIIAGAFSEYSTIVRNGIARINIAEPSQEKQYLKSVLALQSAKETQIIAYPNPAASFVTVDNLEPGSTLRIFNSIGKEVHSETMIQTKSTIELAGYSTGIYFIVAESKETRSASKFIVSK